MCPGKTDEKYEDLFLGASFLKIDDLFCVRVSRLEKTDQKINDLFLRRGSNDRMLVRGPCVGRAWAVRFKNPTCV